MGKKSRERKRRKQNMDLTPKERKSLREDIYEKLFVAIDLPIILWFCERFKGDKYPAWEEAHKWMERWGGQKPHGTHSIPEIMYNLRSLVENGLEKIRSGMIPEDVICVYYISEVDIPPDEHSDIKVKWSSSVLHIGQGIREKLPTLHHFDWENPFLSSWMATEIIKNILARLHSGLNGLLGPTGGTATA